MQYDDEEELVRKPDLSFKMGIIENKTPSSHFYAVIPRYDCEITQDGWVAYISRGMSEEECRKRAEKLINLLNH